MTIKEKMLQRRQQAKESVKEELQREVDKVDEFMERLQKSDLSSTEFCFLVYNSGESNLEVENRSGKSLYLDLSNKIGMKPQEFRKFLVERLQKEGIELSENELKISLL